MEATRRVSPVSGSLSFASTPDASPVSLALAVTLSASAAATGASLIPVMLSVTVAVVVPPALSRTV
jgi:hypothetical protein